MVGATIKIRKDGKVEIEWEGYHDETCYHNAEKLYELLKKRGVNVEVKKITPKMELAEENVEEYTYTQEREGIGW